jgi:hypothetical protein
LEISGSRWVDPEINSYTSAALSKSFAPADFVESALWCQEWELELNLSKCTSVYYVQKPSQQQYKYTVYGINIKTLDQVKYPGIAFE